MKLFLIKIQSLKMIGIKNVFDVLFYRIRIKFGLSSACTVKEKLNTSHSYFNYPNETNNLIPNKKWDSVIRLFDHHTFNINNNTPNWFLNYFNNRSHQFHNTKWWKIKDFDDSIGDIKLIWELSRMDWLIPFAQKGAIGDKKYIDKLNNWINDWVKNNQPYLGPNWKCGQEASIRVINLALTCYLLDQKDVKKSNLLKLVEIHLQRIKPTIQYALAQNNNHGTSEAAALFIGGSWLSYMNINSGKVFMDAGRKLIEDRVSHLIDDTGTFSQYSSNYHRLMLDTLSFIEIWRRYIDKERFSDTFYLKGKLATNWLEKIIFNDKGQTPNLGANDGAKFFQTNNSCYSDYRPSVNLASSLFNNLTIFNDENSSYHLKWLRINQDNIKKVDNNIEDKFKANGFYILKKKDIKFLFRHPHFKFRPSQSDLLHLDIWYKNKNILTDSGSYSYNSIRHYYYSGVESHNTIQFDNRDQMPRLSRFLYGSWPSSSKVETKTYENKLYYSSSYSDFEGARHRRSFSVNEKSVDVIDEISNFKQKAILRWHFNDKHQKITEIENGLVLHNRYFDLEIKATSEIIRYDVRKVHKSLNYFSEVDSKVLEVEFSKKSKIYSSFKFIN